MDDSPAKVRFSEREPADLRLDRRPPDPYHPPADQGGPGIRFWIGVGIVVLLGVVIVRRRSAHARSAGSGSDAPPALPSPPHNVSKIPRSPLVEHTDSHQSAVTGPRFAAPVLRSDTAVPPTTVDAAPPTPRRLGRFTPSPKLARFALVPLLASFILAYLAIRTAGDNTMSEAIPLAVVSFVALGAAFYLAPAS